ncbi:MAG: response regulator [Planctomycetaceae bacterium]|nr:response regulator [Planctomycetaceae bacterium]
MTFIDFKVFDFFDIVLLVLIPVIAMGVATVLMCRSCRSRWFFVVAWAALILVIAAGVSYLGHQVRFQRQGLLDYFAETAKAYAILFTKLGHYQIQAGNELFFSDWSETAAAAADSVPSAPLRAADAPGGIVSGKEELAATIEKLPPPAGLTVRRFDAAGKQTEVSADNPWELYAVALLRKESDGAEPQTQLAVQWKSVPSATAYCLQWNRLDKTRVTAEEYNEAWQTVYSGSQTLCTLAAPSGTLQLRVRAENGTPEDDPVFRSLYNVLTQGVAESVHIAYIYTMRFTDDGQKVYFVVSPPADANHNNEIDKHEGPTRIGEFYDYPLPNSMRKVYNKHTGAINLLTDKWGSWITAFYPLFTPDGKFEGMVGVDFPADLWYRNIQNAKFYAYVFFAASMITFFGGLLLIFRLQHSESNARAYALALRQSVNELTEAKKAVEESSRVKSEFLANMSHEIRTPMNAVLGMIHLARQTELNAKQQMYLENANQSADLLLRIINDILDFSKIEAGKMVMESHVFSLGSVINGLHTIVGHTAQNKNLHFVLPDLSASPIRLVGDDVRLQQVLVNLLTNAVKFTKEGKVELQIDEIESNGQKITLQFSISDTGIGMTAKQMSAIFRPFMQADASTTRKFGGTGLGLTICKNIVEMMHGKIWVESTVSQGTTFYFTAEFDLPKSAGEQSSLMTASSGGAENISRDVIIPPELHGKRILLAEDNKINQMVASELLRMKGFDVDIAENGKVALDLLKYNTYAAVLMDIQTPEMDGLEAVNELRKNPKWANLPVIAMTAHAMSSDRSISLDAGMNDHITKPIDPNQLYQTLIRWIK